VSVPVLSVQMIVVSPSVSTADRRRTSALRLAIRCDAIASDIVTVGSSPFGTSETVTPIAKTNRSWTSMLCVSPLTTKKTQPIVTASAATM
jgi:hypothetical protein